MTPQIPKKLYRYTAIREHTERIFLHSELYFPGPTSFNDPFDCRAAYSTECSEAAFRELAVATDSWLARVIRTRYPNLPFKAAVSQAYTDRHALVGDDAKKALSDYIAATGICCFAESNDNILMWSHYAAQHTGICIEFSTEQSKLFEGARPVTYTNRCPVFECYSNDLTTIAMQALFRKAPDWAYEKEWRLLWRTARESRVFEPGTLSAVILGSRISDDRAAKVKSWCMTLQPTPTVHRATLNADSYGLAFVAEPSPHAHP